MKLTFLGTSHGVPSKEKYCSCCMLEVGDSIYFIDAGAPVVDELIRMDKNLNNVKAFFTTHAHGDHTNGLFNICHLFSWYFTKTSVDIFLTEERFKKAFIEMLTCLNTNNPPDESRLRIHIASSGVVFEDSNVRITYFPTAHMADRMLSYGILVEAEGHRILFSGDCSQHLAAHDLPPMLDTVPVDLFICELAHFGIEECGEYIERSLADRIIMTHVLESNLDALYEYAKTSNKQIETAYDRMEIVFD